MSEKEKLGISIFAYVIVARSLALSRNLATYNESKTRMKKIVTLITKNIKVYSNFVRRNGSSEDTCQSDHGCRLYPRANRLCQCWYLKVIHMKCGAKRGLKCVILKVFNATNAETRFDSCQALIFQSLLVSSVKKG